MAEQFVRRLAIALALAMPLAGAQAAPAARCVGRVSDDTLRPYDPSLKDATLRAFKTRFEGAPTPDDALLAAQALYRCANGALLVCFVGANLPCGKLNTAKSNKGATAFCSANRDADVVPAFAAGHDTIYAFRCKGGRAVVTEQVLETDARGFAAQYWSPLR